MKKFIPFAVAAAFTLGACASGGGSTHSEQDAAAAIAAAEQETTRANSLGNAWRDTEKMIKAAQKAAKEGKYDDAVKLANKAKEQSSDAIAQYESQKNAGPHL